MTITHTLTADVNLLAGQPVSGYARIEAVGVDGLGVVTVIPAIRDTDANMIFTGPQRIKLINGLLVSTLEDPVVLPDSTGQPSMSPTEWSYRVTLLLDHLQPSQYPVYVFQLGTDLDLADVISVPPTTGPLDAPWDEARDAAVAAAADATAKRDEVLLFADTSDEMVHDFLEDETSDTATAATRRYARVISPLKHGAATDGVTPSSAALVAAFAESSATGWPVVLDGYTFVHDAAIVSPAGVTIRGPGGIKSALSNADTLTGAINVDAGRFHTEDVDFDFGATAKYGIYADQPGATRITIVGGSATGTMSHAVCFNDYVTHSAVGGGFTMNGVVSGVRVRGRCEWINVDRVDIEQWKTYGVEVRGVSGIGAPKHVWTTRISGRNPVAGDPGVVGSGIARQLVRYLGAADAITYDAHMDWNICEGPAQPFNPGTNNNGTGDQLAMQFVDYFTANYNVSTYGGENGMSITDSCTDGEVAYNRCAFNDGHGIQGSRSSTVDGPTAQARRVMFHHNHTWNNNQDRIDPVSHTAPGSNGGLCAGLFLQDSVDCSAHDNQSWDDQTPKTQNSGILVSTSTMLSLYDNDLDGNKTTGLSETGTRTYRFRRIKDATTLGDGAGAPVLRLNGAAGQRREFRTQTNGVDRLRFGTTANLETGANAGSNFFFDFVMDDGSTLVNTITGDRASGKLTFLKDVAILGTFTTKLAAPYVFTAGAAINGGTSTTEQLMLTIPTIAASSLAVGSVIRVRVHGNFDNVVTSGTFLGRVKVNGVSLWNATLAPSQTGAATGTGYDYDLELTVTATGVGGAVMLGGSTIVVSTATGTQIARTAQAAATAVDLSGGLTVTLHGTTSGANAGNILRVLSVTVTQPA